MHTQTDPYKRGEAPLPEGAPAHYRHGETDLYAQFIAAFGFDAWAQHAEMECIQYLWRCRKKRQYADDIRKVIVICQRILDEYPKSPHG